MDTTMSLMMPGEQPELPDTNKMNVCNEPVYVMRTPDTPELPQFTISNTASLAEDRKPSDYYDVALPDGVSSPITPRSHNIFSHRVSINMPFRTGSLLDELQFDELTKLQAELSRTKAALNERAETHQEQVNKIKAKQACAGVIKEHKQRASIANLQLNYKNELEQINHKLRITQNLHIKDIRKIKKSDVQKRLEIKLRDKRIRELIRENKALTASKAANKKQHELRLQQLHNDYDQQMERQVNKRMAQITQIKAVKNKIIEELHQKAHAKYVANDDDPDAKGQLIQKLRVRITKLERDSQKEQDMFFKHNEIFEYKLERAVNEKRALEKQWRETKAEKDYEVKLMNAEMDKLKQKLSTLRDVNIRMEQTLKMTLAENKRLRALREDYQTFAANVDADYDEMNEIMQDLQTKNMEKEDELNKMKASVKETESENKTLRTSVSSHSQTIKQLQNMLAVECEDKKKEIDRIMDEEGESDAMYPSHSYSTSYLSMDMDHELNLKHIGELESIKVQYNELIQSMNEKHDTLTAKYEKARSELDDTQKLLRDMESSKVRLLTTFVEEMDRMRTEIKKQNISTVGFVECS